MRDLENEFSKLIEELRARIEEKKLAGELADDEAERLNDMVNDRLDGWDTSDCYSDDDDGWQSSSYRC